MEEQNQNSSDIINVESYTRADGTDVKAHIRHKPGRGSFDNGNFAPERPFLNSMGGIVPHDGYIFDEMNYPITYTSGGIVQNNNLSDLNTMDKVLNYLPVDFNDTILDNALNSNSNEIKFQPLKMDYSRPPVLEGRVEIQENKNFIPNITNNSNFKNTIPSYNTNNVNNSINKVSKISDLDTTSVTIKPETNIFKQASDDFLVGIANKSLADAGGYVFSHWKKTPEAYDFYKMASPNYNYNPEYVKNNGVLHDSADNLGDAKVASRIKARLYLENTGMKDCKVFESNADSSISQKIANSDELKKEIKKNIDFIRKYNTFPTKYMEFSSPDLYNTIHGANIEDAHIDKDGNLNFSVEDLYNFNKGRTSVRGRVGEKLQNEGSLIPYYIKVNIKIPKSELDKY